MGISSRQARAAQAYLDLRQKDICDATGVTRQNLRKFYKDGSSVGSEKQDALKAFYEQRGIEFMDYDGIREKPSGVLRTLYGYEGFKEFIYDVYSTVSESGGNICVTNVDERQFERWQGANAEDYLSKMAQVESLSFQILVREGDDYYTASKYAKYRELPVKYFGGVPTYIYGDKKAEILFGDDEVTIFLSENAQLAEAERKQFSLLWENVIA